MMIRKMTASFGKLHNETLELTDGLNVVSLPNESGKSTWSEFLLAMLYGVDTAERQRSGGPIPVKERFAPWNGGAMQGSMEVEKDGRRITIERTSKVKAPMSCFAAYLTDSGLPVEDLDGNTCGAVLVGAERGVYERSGFLRQRGIGLSKDASLEQRLAGLVSTADEDYSFIEIEEELKTLKNRCKHNNTGLLPTATQELAGVEQKLTAMQDRQKKLSDLQTREQELLARVAELQKLCEAWKADREQKHLQKLVQQQTVTEEATARRKAAETACEGLPQREEATALSEAIAVQLGKVQIAFSQAATLPPTLPQQPQSAVFAGKSAAEAKAQTARDRVTAETLLNPTGAKLLLPALLAAAGVAAVCTVLALVLPQLWLLLPAGLALLAVPVLLLLQSNRKKDGAAEAAMLLGKYGVRTPAEMDTVAEQYAQAWSDYETNIAQIHRRREAVEETQSALAREETALLERLRQYFPDCDSLQTGSRLLAQTKTAWAALEQAQQKEATERRALELLRGTTDGVTTVGVQTEAALPADITETKQQLKAAETALTELRNELHRTRGLLDGLGDRLALEAMKEKLSARIEELQKKYGALMLAQETLCEANAEVQSRFAPILCGRASELLGRLTGGKYDKLLLDRDMSAVCRQAGDSVTHTAAALSCGTSDQVYLAVRLAICELLLEDAPLVLDDALVAFDDERCRLAMQVLREVAQTRQVIVFTCQSRELEM